MWLCVGDVIWELQWDCLVGSMGRCRHGPGFSWHSPAPLPLLSAFAEGDGSN